MQPVYPLLRSEAAHLTVRQFLFLLNTLRSKPADVCLSLLRPGRPPRRHLRRRSRTTVLASRLSDTFTFVLAVIHRAHRRLLYTFNRRKHHNDTSDAAPQPSSVSLQRQTSSPSCAAYQTLTQRFLCISSSCVHIVIVNFGTSRRCEPRLLHSLLELRCVEPMN